MSESTCKITKLVDYHDIPITFMDSAVSEAELEAEIEECCRLAGVEALTDETAALMSRDECKTAEEFKELVRRELTEGRKQLADSQAVNDAMQYVIENSEMEIPEVIIDRETQTMMQEMRGGADGSLASMADMIGRKMEDILAELRPQALIRIQTNVVLQAIAQEEKIEVIDFELNKFCKELYNISYFELKKKQGEEFVEQLREELKLRKAFYVIMQGIRDVNAPVEGETEEVPAWEENREDSGEI
ncbi:MAG: hypothetical protein HUJ69_03945 [Lachnospiraceae bacterium]|nr:hypothetical protein [Lachnospiraceae bacterium]